MFRVQGVGGTVWALSRKVDVLDPELGAVSPRLDQTLNPTPTILKHKPMPQSLSPKAGRA